MKVRKVPFDGAQMLEDIWHLSLRYASDDRQLSCEPKSGAQAVMIWRNGLWSSVD